MICQRLEFTAAETALQLVASDALPGAAAAALDDGCDSPSLRALAGLTASEMDEAGSLFEAALGELGLLLPSARDAALRLARRAATEVLENAIPPDAGARQIWEISLCVPEEHLPSLDPFVYAASEWDERPEDRERFADGIRAAARELVQR
jgi:hypothetical protein